MDLVGYASKWSAEPGERVSFMVSFHRAFLFRGSRPAHSRRSKSFRTGL